jgi:NhaP-type Na+/H+ or K+/H+ antiporter
LRPPHEHGRPAPAHGYRPLTTDPAIFWFALIGAVLVVMSLAATLVSRLPLSSSTLYLALGVALGPIGFEKIRVDPVAHAAWVHRFVEVAVLVSLFTAGLKLRLPLRDPRWWTPVALALISMVLTVAAVTAAGAWGLGLSLGAAVLLGAILAPTDPVLASDVQLENPFDRDRVRFAVTGEAGLNDGTAFPFVMLGLGLLGHHALGPWGWRWWAIDVLWAVAAGLAIGGGLGCAVARLVLYLRRTHRAALGRDELLTLGLIALAYGAALSVKAYGFLAVFAAGLALRQVEMKQTPDDDDNDDDDPKSDPAADTAPRPDAVEEAEDVDPRGGKPDELATRPETAPAHLAHTVLHFNEQLERLLEVALVILVGAMLTRAHLTWDLLWFVPLLFLVFRPLAVYIGLARQPAEPAQRRLIAWFGIRGIGSIYYLMYTIEHGLAPADAHRLTGLVLATIAISIVVHGASVTPLMTLYQRTRRGRRPP